MEHVLVSIDQELLKKIDDEVQHIGNGASRSGFLRDAAIFYLKNIQGFSYYKRRNSP